MIWDTAGQEEFDALTATYYRGEREREEERRETTSRAANGVLGGRPTSGRGL
jgi:hypothetical protein